MEPKKVSANGLISVCKGLYINSFKINPPIFCCPLFSENYLNPWFAIHKIVNKHTAVYRLSYFYGLQRALSLLSLFWIFFFEYIPPWLRKSFTFNSVKITADTFGTQKIESVQFFSCLQAKLCPRFLSLFPGQTGIAHSSRTFSEDIFSWAERGLSRKRG